MFKQQLCVNADVCRRLQGNCVSVGVTTLTATASLKDAYGSSIGGLGGNTTILFSNCWANFTDLSILYSGTSASCFLHRWSFKQPETH